MLDNGFTLSIDDFGTGYSSFSYLIDSRFSEVKIYGSLISGVAGDAKQLEMIRAIISLSKIYNKVVVAEGVDTKDDMEALKNIGCDVIQGYYIAKPMPVEECTKWLKLRVDDTSNK